MNKTLRAQMRVITNEHFDESRRSTGSRANLSVVRPPNAFAITLSADQPKLLAGPNPVGTKLLMGPQPQHPHRR